MTETRTDEFLGGRLRIEQPAYGYRSGADSVMLAAACPAKAGEHVLELGCGAGVVLFCLAMRVKNLGLTGVEKNPDFAALARANAERNSVNATIINADLRALPVQIREQCYDHVIMNPPYFLSGTSAPEAARAAARHEDTPLADWLDMALRRLRPGGNLTVVHLADRLDELLCGLRGRAGDIAILPISAFAGRDAGRILLSARKCARGPVRLLAPFIMHFIEQNGDKCSDFTRQAYDVLRNMKPILLKS